MSIKFAKTDHPVQEMIATRYSPYAFSDRPVSGADLRSIFEAARWAPSSYNEQPWSYIVATKEDAGEFERLLSCLVEPNQDWAKLAPVLALGVTRSRFARNDQENGASRHDLGAASAHLTFEATARGLSVHQMIGIVPERARELYQIPEHSEALTALAIGYAADPADAASPYRERDAAPRERKSIAAFVFTGTYGQSKPPFAEG